MFSPVIYDKGNVVDLLIGAETFTKGDACIFNGSGHMIKSTGGGTVPIFYVINEDVLVAPTAGARTASFVRTISTPIFIAESSTTPTQAQCGTHVDTITNAGLVNTATSVSDLFFVEKIISASGKTVQGWFKGFTVEV